MFPFELISRTILHALEPVRLLVPVLTAGRDRQCLSEPPWPTAPALCFSGTEVAGKSFYKLNGSTRSLDVPS